MKPHTNAMIHRTVLPLLCWSLVLLPVTSVQALNDKTVSDSPCSIINTGEISGNVELKCSGLSDKAIANIEKLLQSQADTLFKTLDNQNSHIELLQEKIASLKADRDKALQENKQDQKKQPLNPLLEQEQQALLDYDFLKAAELRDQYYEELKEKRITELAREALTSAERWETAFKLDKALKRYQEASQFTPDLPEAWRGIHQTAKKLGNYQLALAAAQSMQKHLDPEKDKWSLAIAYEDQGDALVALGRNKEAMQKYQKRQELFTEIAQQSPDNPSVKRELSVSYGRVGDMHKANGNNKDALNAYQNGLEIAKQLAKLDPNHTEWQRDLSISYERVGNMHTANGDNNAALNAYQEALIIRKQLAKLNPNHTEWQRDLSVSYERVGDMHTANGDNNAALNAYQEALTIRKQLAKLDPNHTEWQRDLFIAQSKVADMEVLQGNIENALEVYKAVLATNKQLAKLDPNVVKWQTDLVVSYYKLSQIQDDKQHQLLSDALAILQRLHKADKLDHESKGWIPFLEQAVQDTKP